MSDTRPNQRPPDSPSGSPSDSPSDIAVPPDLARVAAYRDVLSESFARFRKEWGDFIRFPSVGADPSHAGDCRACAAWLARKLEAIGMKSELVETSGLPCVYGEYYSGNERPTVLVYGHYDVQPIEPREAWASDPYELTERQDRFYGRGAQDNKGQLWYAVKAIETLIGRGELACNVKILVEGEEESGSGGLRDALGKIGRKVAADVLLVCDTGTPEPGRPAVTLGLRGVVSLEATLQGPRHDLHSGVHGGVCRNPAIELARMIAALHDERGTIAIPGYLDGLPEATEDDISAAAEGALSDEAYEKFVGVPPNGGETGVSFGIRRGFRPTIDVNGMYSGHTGPGGKTIIPATATVKLSSRLGAGQDPSRCLDLLKSFLGERVPRGMRLEFSGETVGGPGFRLGVREPLVQWARALLTALFGRPALLLWEGASIPIIPALAEASGASPLLVGFGWESDAIHAPNESFSRGQWGDGFVTVCALLSDRTLLTSARLAASGR